MKNETTLTFEKYLNSIFERRYQKNSSYSLRAFARDMGIPSANLSRALNGSRGFSKKTLEQVSKKLELNKEESSLLELLCEKQFSKSTKSKQDAALKLKQALLYQYQIANDKVSLISDWYHMAILAMMDSNHFQSDYTWIASQLGVHAKVAEQAVERLISVGAIRKEQDQLVSTGNLFVDPKGIPSTAVKDFHHQIIKKADEAIELQNLEDRDIASMVLCFDKAKMKAAKEKIRKFREEFDAEFAPTKTDTEQAVYGLGIQFFQITKFNELKNNKEIQNEIN